MIVYLQAWLQFTPIFIIKRHFVCRVVGFRVETASVAKDAYEVSNADLGCSIKQGHGPQMLKEDGEKSLHGSFTQHIERHFVCSTYIYI